MPHFGLDVPDVLLNNGYEILKTVFYDMDQTKKTFLPVETFTCRLKTPQTPPRTFSFHSWLKGHFTQAYGGIASGSRWASQLRPSITVAVGDAGVSPILMCAETYVQ